jgi:hypothetical protein
VHPARALCGGRASGTSASGRRFAQATRQREAESSDLVSNINRRMRLHIRHKGRVWAGKLPSGSDRVAAVGGGRSGQDERRQQGPGTVLSTTQRLQGTFESTVRSGKQSGKVLNLQHGAGSRR